MNILSTPAPPGVNGSNGPALLQVVLWLDKKRKWPSFHGGCFMRSFGLWLHEVCLVRSQGVFFYQKIVDQEIFFFQFLFEKKFFRIFEKMIKKHPIRSATSGRVNETTSRDSDNLSIGQRHLFHRLHLLQYSHFDGLIQVHGKKQKNILIVFYNIVNINL